MERCLFINCSLRRTEPNRLGCFDDGTHGEQLLYAVEVGKEPGAIAILPDSSQAFVANAGSASISAVDLRSRKLLAHLETGRTPAALALKPDGGELFVTNFDSDSLTVVNTYADEVAQSLRAGKNPSQAVVDSSGGLLFITKEGFL